MEILDLPEVWQRRIASGEISLTSARELFTLIKSPNVLAAIDRDYQENPEMYSSSRKFAQAVAQVATAHPAVTSARRTWRQTVADDETDAAADTNDNYRPSSNGHAAAGSLQSIPSTMPLSAANSLNAGALVALLWSRIGQLNEIEELDKVRSAEEARRRELLVPTAPLAKLMPKA